VDPGESPSLSDFLSRIDGKIVNQATVTGVFEK
jgi:hypothetical protein